MSLHLDYMKKHIEESDPGAMPKKSVIAVLEYYKEVLKAYKGMLEKRSMQDGEE